jgi:hypothetical protein
MKTPKHERGIQSMMYSEFVKATGCKETENNYQVFLNLEAMYMHTEMTKEEIYEYGRKLVDNSKTAEEIALENEIKAQIDECKETAKNYTENAKMYDEWAKEEMNDIWKKDWKETAKTYREMAKRERARARELKEWFLAG